MEEHAPSGYVKRFIFLWLDEGLLAPEARIRHIDIIHTVKKKNALHIWCTYSEGWDVCTYIQCRLCDSWILRVIRELRDYCWRSFVFYTFVIAKHVVSLCLLQPQGFPKAFVMEIWRHLSMQVSWTFFPQVLWYWNCCYFYFHFILCQTYANSLT